MNFPPFNKLIMSANESKRCAVQVSHCQLWFMIHWLITVNLVSLWKRLTPLFLFHFSRIS